MQKFLWCRSDGEACREGYLLVGLFPEEIFLFPISLFFLILCNIRRMKRWIFPRGDIQPKNRLSPSRLILPIPLVILQGILSLNSTPWALVGLVMENRNQFFPFFSSVIHTSDGPQADCSHVHCWQPDLLQPGNLKMSQPVMWCPHSEEFSCSLLHTVLSVHVTRKLLILQNMEQWMHN